MHIAFFLLLLLFSCQQKKKYQPLQPGEYFVSGCSVFDAEGNLQRNFGLGHCLFFPNGNMFHAQEKSVVMRDGQGKKLWRKFIPSHHLPILIENKIIVLSSEDKKFQGMLTRFDVLYQLSLEGKVLKEWHVYDHLSELKQKIGELNPEPSEWFPESKAVQELTHLNSVFAIGAKNALPGSEIFREGNYLLNLHLPSNASIVLDSEWKKILWASSYRINAHDLQLMAGGNLLLFRNKQAEEEKSSIEILELPQEKLLKRLGLKPQQTFFSKVGGTVQQLGDGNFLFTTGDANEQIRIVDQEGERIWGLNPKIPFLNPMLDVKILPLGPYLTQSQN